MYEYYTIYAWSDCPFCVQARELLVKKQKQFAFCLLDDSPVLLNSIKEKYNWQTVPLVLHHEKDKDGIWRLHFIGGYTNLCEALGENSEET